MGRLGPRLWSGPPCGTVGRARQEARRVDASILEDVPRGALAQQQRRRFCLYKHFVQLKKD